MIVFEIDPGIAVGSQSKPCLLFYRCRDGEITFIGSFRFPEGVEVTINGKRNPLLREAGDAIRKVLK